MITILRITMLRAVVTVKFTIETLRCHNSEDNDNFKKNQYVETAEQQLCTCITLLCTFLSRHCTTTTGKCLFSRFTEDVNKRRLNFLSLSELEYDS